MDKLIVFTRYPVPGKTKTRLIPDLGPVNAADVHRKLTENIISQIKQLHAEKDFHFEVCYTGGSIEAMKSWLGDSITYTEQVQGDLGKRMHSAIKSAIHIGCTKVVLIGTDILELIPGHVEQAFNALDKTDIVLGPTIDGGYWLVGMRMAFNIFTGIPWGTETVIAQTLELIKQQGLRLFILPKISDIDDVDDLKKCSDHKIVKQHLSVWLPSRDSPHD